jgi:hypothetical protein
VRELIESADLERQRRLTAHFARVAAASEALIRALENDVENLQRAALFGEGKWKRRCLAVYGVLMVVVAIEFWSRVL